MLKQYKGNDYAFGYGILDKVGEFASQYGRSALLIANTRGRLAPVVDRARAALAEYGVGLAGGRIVPGAGPNAPREDVYRIVTYILHFKPDCLVVIGGGSSIDASKAANVLATLGVYSPEIEPYFGVGQVSQVLRTIGKELWPLIAVQTAASSGAHLTRYSNITDPVAGQKKLIVDDTIVPSKAVFDYHVTETMPISLTVDGSLDGLAHCLEVFYGIGDRFELAREIALTGVELAVGFTRRLIDDPKDSEAREALCLATDLGGYAIMVGGTNGGHLTSFSLVDITSHGRACGVMNPYYTVFFAPAIERQLRMVGEIFRDAGHIAVDLGRLHGRALGVAVAEGMAAFGKSIGAPTRLMDLPGFTDEHIARALAAAKDPQLEMKLKNMPIPLHAALVDEYMGPVLAAAKTGDFSLIRNMA